MSQRGQASGQGWAGKEGRKEGNHRGCAGYAEGKVTDPRLSPWPYQTAPSTWHFRQGFSVTRPPRRAACDLQRGRSKTGQFQGDFESPGHDLTWEGDLGTAVRLHPVLLSGLFQVQGQYTIYKDYKRTLPCTNYIRVI